MAWMWLLNLFIFKSILLIRYLFLFSIQYRSIRRKVETKMHFSVFAKMGWFSRNFTKFRFAINFRFRENVREYFVYFSRKFPRKRKTPIFSKILSIFRDNFCENEKRRFSQKSCLFFAKCFSKTKNADFRENERYFLKNICEYTNFLLII
jgi:hypothetical protein